MRRYVFVLAAAVALAPDAHAQMSPGNGPLTPSTQAIQANSGVAAALGSPLNAAGGLLSYSILGASGATIPLNNTANTESGLWTFTGGLTVQPTTFAPSSSLGPATTGLYARMSPTGTGCAASGYCYYNFLSIDGDNVASATGNTAYYFNDVIGGPNMTGNRANGVFGFLFNSKPNATTAGTSYSGLAIDATATVNDNGTSATPIGILNGLNIVMGLASGATYWEAMQGQEIDLNAPSGSSMNTKEGLSIVQFTTDKVAGTQYDAALAISNSYPGGAVGWKNGLVFGGMEGVWPLQSTATAIGCPYGCGTLGSVLDFSGATISNYFLHGPGFGVDGNGNTTVKSLATNGALTVGAANVLATPMQYGCVGDGVTDDTTCVQNAINAAATGGFPLRLDDGMHTYFTSTGWSSSGLIDLEGQEPVGNDGVSNAQKCTSGLATNSNITMLALTGPKAIVRNICIQMTPDASTARASGDAILLGGTDQEGDVIEGNTIFRPYEGIGIGAAGGLTRDGAVRNNTIRDPALYGISVGRGTTGGVTANWHLVNNKIGCDAGYNTNGIGFAYFDGGVTWDGTNIGPSNCYIGTYIYPGANQNVNGTFSGVLGDSSGTHYTGGGTAHDLYINTAASSANITFLSFINAWAAGTIPADNEVYVGNTANGVCGIISFVGNTFHGGTSSGQTQTVPIVDIEGACAQIVFSGNRVDGWMAGISDIGLQIGPSPSHLTVTGNHFGADVQQGASLVDGIYFSSTAPGFTTITGNDLSLTTTPVAYSSPANTDRVVFSGNEGIDDLCPSVASASTITLSGVNPCYHLTGTNSISLIFGAYGSRRVTVIADNGLTLSNGGTASGTNYPICAASVALAAGASTQLTWNSAGTCWSHAP